MNTIFALTTGVQKAGVAVIRTSGSNVLEIASKITDKDGFIPRRAEFSNFYNPQSKILLDKGLVIYFESPNSFTGEDIVEYHIHGGLAIVQSFLSVLNSFDNCRMAEPGEFTRRAFENGKIDLTAAEAIADLVDAETEAQQMQALDQLGGGLAKIYDSWANILKKLLANQEAEIEFPEDDLPEGLLTGSEPKIIELTKDIKEHLDDKRRGERLRNGILIAILGAPNVGKSSLLNRIAQRDAAIVSDIAGTTRDIIEVHLNLGGYPIILADTAGIHATEDKIESEGIKRACDLVGRADIKIVLFDSTSEKIDNKTEELIDNNTIIVLTKSDLAKARLNYRGAYNISSLTGNGIEALLKTITDRISKQFVKNNKPSLTRERHRIALKETLEALERSLGASLPELAAEDLRLAMRNLGSITGKVHIEEVLDKIFKDFCIGK